MQELLLAFFQFLMNRTILKSLRLMLYENYLNLRKRCLKKPNEEQKAQGCDATAAKSLFKS